MNSFINNIKSAASAASGDNKKPNSDQTSNTDLISKAKVVAEAAKSAKTNLTEKTDKTKVTGAGANLLDSVKQYGKLDESQGVGQYIKQAEDYLHKFGKQAPAPATVEKKVEVSVTTPLKEEKKGEAPVPAPVEEKKDEALTPAPLKEEEKDEAPVLAPEEEKGGKDETGSGIGAGDAVKAAENFFK
ncbi:hypothetical protein QVD17_35514 [Tagetes erecta]|uniref:Uncharacterized protein n=1 Tax=Tagetes erecta TaxID=13708 RepID=A0AAD8JZM5_TARER|nr:hypothetical protein QVD17_35514 [Tagetes erecta]